MCTMFQCVTLRSIGAYEKITLMVFLFCFTYQLVIIQSIKLVVFFMFQDSRLITIQFSWKKEVKPKGSSLIGVSPEFETALYTVAYMMGKQEYHAILGKDRVIIKCHRRKDGMIGTCYLQEPHFEHWR